MSFPEPPQPKLPQDVRIGFLVHDVSRMRRTLFDQAMKPLGITRSQWWVLSQLSRHARTGMLQTDLARDLDVGKVTVGGLIDRLEAAGYVVRQPDAVDRRAKRIVITEEGRAVLKQMVTVGQSLNRVILAGLSQDEVEATERALSVMKDNIRQATADRDDADLSVGVFAGGTALAAVGGAMWADYQEQVTVAIGADMTVLVFIVVIIGGLGSMTGCLVAAVLVGLVTNYVGFLLPALSLGTAVAVMVAVLLWRPRGLFPVSG